MNADLAKPDNTPPLVHRTRLLIGRRLTALRGSINLAFVYVGACTFYLWTSITGGYPFSLGGNQADPYNELTDGFLKGHLYLPLQVPPGLAQMKNPYDPTNNEYSSLFHDLSYYHGHFYLVWGPTPVFSLFMPWRLLHVGGIPENIAVCIFSCATLFFTFLLLKYVVTTYLPAARLWQITVAAIGLACGNVLPFLLRRPIEYEVAISCSIAYAMAGLFFLTKGYIEKSNVRLLIGSLCIGLAGGGHSDALVYGAIIPILAGALLLQYDRGKRRNAARSLTAVVVPFVLIISLYAIYNWARFGSITQFGIYYQLASIDVQTTPLAQPGYLAPGLFYYFIEPVRLSLEFPYFSIAPPAYPGTLPAQYSLEIVSGVFATSPIIVASGLGITILHRRIQHELTQLIILFASLGTLVALVLAFVSFGATMRYEGDFATPILLAGVLGWLAITPSLRRLPSMVWRSLGTVLLIYGSLAGIGISITGYYFELEGAEPGTFRALESATSFFPTAIAMIEGHPVLSNVVAPNGSYETVQWYSLDFGTSLAFYLSEQASEVDVISPCHCTYYLSGLIQSASANIPSLGRVFLTETAGNSRHTTSYAQGRYWSIAVPLSVGLNRVMIAVSATHPSVIAATAPVLEFENVLLTRSA